MIKVEKETQSPSTLKKERINIFKKFQPRKKESFKKVPIHFQFTTEALITIDHSTKTKRSTTLSRATSSMGYSRRPSSRQRIFDKKRCQSLRSGVDSTIDPSENRDTICSEQRIKRGMTFQSSNPVSIRQDSRSLEVHQNMRELISFNNTQKTEMRKKTPNNITFSYQSPKKTTTLIYQQASAKRQVFNEPMNPLDLYELLKKKPCNVSSKKKQKRQTFKTIQTSLFSTINPISFRDSQPSARQMNIYRI